MAMLPLLVPFAVHARDMGTFGATYPVAERDALSEIEERAKGVDWSKVIGRKRIEEYDGPEEGVRLPRAARDRAFTVDMSWTLQMDIPDGKGGVLYPKGYSFNPLDYVNFIKTLVLIDGNDPEQVQWFASSEYKDRVEVMLLLTGGAYRSLGRKLNLPLFYADSRIIERLRISAVPSVVRQEGRAMVVREYAVSKRPEKRGGQ